MVFREIKKPKEIKKYQKKLSKTESPSGYVYARCLVFHFLLPFSRSLLRLGQNKIFTLLQPHENGLF